MRLPIRRLRHFLHMETSKLDTPVVGGSHSSIAGVSGDLDGKQLYDIMVDTAVAADDSSEVCTICYEVCTIDLRYVRGMWFFCLPPGIHVYCFAYRYAFLSTCHMDVWYGAVIPAQVIPMPSYVRSMFCSPRCML